MIDAIARMGTPIAPADFGKATDNAEKSTLAVFDARPKLNAQANKLKGGGFEDTNHYQNIDL